MAGVGQRDYDARRVDDVASGAAPAGILPFNHAHNEWIDMAAKRGLIGVLALMAFMLIPGWLFVRALRPAAGHLTIDESNAAICGVLTVLGYLGFGITQVMFAHNSGNMPYLFMITLWIGALMRPGTSRHEHFR